MINQRANAEFVSASKHWNESLNAPSDIARLFHLSEAYVAYRNIIGNYSGSDIAVDLLTGEMSLPFDIADVEQRILIEGKTVTGNCLIFLMALEKYRAAFDAKIIGPESAVSAYLHLYEANHEAHRSFEIAMQGASKLGLPEEIQYLVDHRLLETFSGRLSQAKEDCKNYTGGVGPAQYLLREASQIAAGNSFKQLIVALAYAQIGDVEKACKLADQVLTESAPYPHKWIPELVWKVAESSSAKDAMAVAERFDATYEIERSTSALINIAFMNDCNGSRLHELDHIVEFLRKHERVFHICRALIDASKQRSNIEKARKCLEIALNTSFGLRDEVKEEHHYIADIHLKIAIEHAKRSNPSEAQRLINNVAWKHTGFWDKRRTIAQNRYYFSYYYYCDLALAKALLGEMEEASAFLSEAQTLFVRDPSKFDSTPLVEAFLQFSRWEDALNASRPKDGGLYDVNGLALICIWLWKNDQRSDVFKVFDKIPRLEHRRRVLVTLLASVGCDRIDSANEVFKKYAGICDEDAKSTGYDLDDIAYLSAFFGQIKEFKAVRTEGHVSPSAVYSVIKGASESTLPGSTEALVDFIVWSVEKMAGYESFPFLTEFISENESEMQKSSKYDVLSIIEENTSPDDSEGTSRRALCRAGRGQLASAYQMCRGPSCVEVLCSVATQISELKDSFAFR